MTTHLMRRSNSSCSIKSPIANVQEVLKNTPVDRSIPRSAIQNIIAIKQMKIKVSAR